MALLCRLTRLRLAVAHSQAQFLYLSVDGTSVPSDFYLSLAGNFTAAWRDTRFGESPLTNSSNVEVAAAAVWDDAKRRESYELARRLTERKLAAQLVQL